MINKMKIFNAGPAPVISAIWEQLNIGKNLDTFLTWDTTQCKLSPGIRIKALVINILATRTPLYLVSRFYLYQDLANLFGKGVLLQDLNDDCLARALDKLAESNPKKVISCIIIQALSSENITITHLHSAASALITRENQILQRRVRNALEAQGEYITVAGKIKTEKPTGNRILELLKPIQTIGYIEGGKECRVLPETPNEEPLERILF